MDANKKVSEGWNGDGDDFRCGVCMVKEVRQLRMENGESKKEMERMKHVEEERTQEYMRSMHLKRHGPTSQRD